MSIRIERQSIILLSLAALILSACGGAGGTSAPTNGPTTGASATAPAETTDGPPTEGSPAATDASPTSTPPSGGSGQGVCELVTVAELTTILGGTNITTRVIAGPPDTCDVQRDGAPVAAWVHTPQVGAQVFELLAMGADAEPLSGIGEAAFYSAETQLVAVRKGDAMLSVAVHDIEFDEAAQKARQIEIAKVAAGRL